MVWPLRRETPGPTSSLQQAEAAGESGVDDLVARVVAAKAAAAGSTGSTGGKRRRGWLLRRALLVADLTALTCSFALVEWAMPGSKTADHIRINGEIILFVLTLPVWVVVAKLHGLYDGDEERAAQTTADDLVGVLHLVALGTWVLLAAGWATRWAAPETSKLLVFGVLAVVLVTVARAIARACARRTQTYVQNTVVVGAGSVGRVVARKLLGHREYGINLVGFVDSDPVTGDDPIAGLPVLGGADVLPDLIRDLSIERVVIAFSREPHEETLRVLRALKDFDVQVDIVPRFFEILGTNVCVHMVEGLPLLGMPPVRLARSSRLLKRAVDVVLASLALILLSPSLAAVALMIKLDSRGPVFFRQTRMGSGDRTFQILKFRTMRDGADDVKSSLSHLNMHNGDDARMFKIPNDPRVTRVGHVLRRFSLDELPQLFNVLLGQMSLVGPRPLVLAEDQHVVAWARKRLELKPGVTGLWQVLGASEIPFDEMTRLDYVYVTSWSLWGDLRLMLQTIPALARARRAY
ncbi:MAG TPA: sugar transferase [Gaiellaceae bacterium]|nr:sugar transferase [Gaiellaceae bacterium]